MGLIPAPVRLGPAGQVAGSARHSAVRDVGVLLGAGQRRSRASCRVSRPRWRSAWTRSAATTAGGRSALLRKQPAKAVAFWARASSRAAAARRTGSVGVLMGSPLFLEGRPMVGVGVIVLAHVVPTGRT